MARKKKELPVIHNVEITGVAAEGKSIAKVKIKETDDTPVVVFVPYGAPGDIVDLKIDKKKKSYAEAHIVSLTAPSSIRCAPKCEYFGLCGGCKWQHLPYEEQLKFKRQQVVDALERIGKVEFPEVPLTLGSENIWEYRNKMEYTFSNKRWKSWEEIKGEKESKEGVNALGFHIPGSFDKVLHINKCWLQDSIGDRVRNYLYSQGLQLDEKVNQVNGEDPNFIFYDIKENKGLLRTVMIRPTITGELMVCLVFGAEDSDISRNTNLSEKLMTDLLNEFPEITTLVYVINKKVNDSIADQEVKIFYGKGFVEEKLGDLKFRISAKSFYQTNSRQAEVLYKTAADFAGLLESKVSGNSKGPLIYDLYTGTGTIANYVAKKASKVIGIEYVEDAIKDAKINSEINSIKNTEFYAGDMKDVLTDDFIKTNGKPDIMIVDPPRAGMHEDVIKVILNASPEIIVYVSCNPATQARDISMLSSKYIITRVQPVDMFPHTHHVENIVKLELKS
ncbi:MAG: 23S rRNA (uracil(1939)-C(5))-methyltransferase RlmD [Muribaculaceae bacterium]|nr:23S rRNA (uracil(1939)-C(5))-methyltransferase RlmD [Muribaculaceae bacterium]